MGIIQPLICSRPPAQSKPPLGRFDLGCWTGSRSWTLMISDVPAIKTQCHVISESEVTCIYNIVIYIYNIVISNIVIYIYTEHIQLCTYITNHCTYQYISLSVHLSLSSAPSPFNEVSIPWPTTGMKRSWIRSLRIQQRILRAWLACAWCCWIGWSWTDIGNPKTMEKPMRNRWNWWIWVIHRVLEPHLSQRCGYEDNLCYGWTLLKATDKLDLSNSCLRLP